jgi:hypothetical protein
MLSLRSAVVRRAGLAGVVPLAAQLTSGCYSTMPVGSATVGPKDVVLELTDRGRVDLKGALGASPLRVTGRLTAATDSTYTLAVREVETVRGETATWQGEAVTVRRSSVGLVQERRFSRARTALVVLGAVGAVVAFFVTRSLISGGGSDTDTPIPGGGLPPGQGS